MNHAISKEDNNETQTVAILSRMPNRAIWFRSKGIAALWEIKKGSGSLPFLENGAV